MYFIHYGDQTRGPYALDQIRSMWASGIITADAVYCVETESVWKPIAELLAKGRNGLVNTREPAPLKRQQAAHVRTGTTGAAPQGAAYRPLETHAARDGVQSPNRNVDSIAAGGTAHANKQPDHDATVRWARRMRMGSWIVAFLIVLVLVLWKLGSQTSETDTTQEKTPVQVETVQPARLPSPSVGNGISTPQPTTPVVQKPPKLDLVDLAKRTHGAVVLIEVFDEEKNKTATGSGFFVSKTGWLITNYHVIEGAHSAVAMSVSGIPFTVSAALAVDRENDLVLLAADAPGVPFLTLRKSEEVEPGTRVAVIGSPRGLADSLSEGIVAAKRGDDREYKWLQITAAISSGSSGSPVMDEFGNVVGIATMVVTNGQSLNFAVPSEAAARLIRQAQLAPESKRLSELVAEDRQLLHSSPEWKAAMTAHCNAGASTSRAALDRLEAKAAGGGKAIPDTMDETVLRAWNDALRSAKTLVAKYPNFAEGHFFKAKAYEALGFTSEAIGAYRKALMIDRSNEIWWHELAKFYKENGMNAQAAQAFSMAISLCEKGTLRFVHPVYLAEVCRDAGQFDKAVGAYKKAEAFGKMTHSQLDDAGNCYRDAGMLDDAMRAYLAATKAAQTDPGVIKAMALVAPSLRQWHSSGFSDLGRMYADRGQIEKAAEAIHNAIPTAKHSEVWLYVSTLVEQKHPELVQKCDETYRRLKAQGK